MYMNYLLLSTAREGRWSLLFVKVLFFLYSCFMSLSFMYDIFIFYSVISRNPHGCHIIFLSNCFDYSFCAFPSLFSLFVSKNLMRGCGIWKLSFSHLKEMHMMRFIREKPWRHSNEWRAGICLAMNMRYFPSHARVFVFCCFSLLVSVLIWNVTLALHRSSKITQLHEILSLHI